jgi:hypothetical protein
MSRIWKGWGRAIAPFLVASAFVFSPALERSALAQPTAPGGDETPGEESKGRPLDGYLATITLMLLALFIVGKSARR